MSIFFGDNEICDEICDNFLNFIARELSPLPWTLEQLDTSPGTKYFLIGLGNLIGGLGEIAVDHEWVWDRMEADRAGS